MKFTTWAATIAIIVLPLEGALLATSWRNHSCPIGEAVRIPMPFERGNGHAWYAEIPELERLADNLQAYKSPVVVCENDRVLGPAHSYHQDITREGQGRFSHWGTALVFSTSDNSNPNTNGRSYLAIRTKSEIPLSEAPVQPSSACLLYTSDAADE